jgi:hypothetical protein
MQVLSADTAHSVVTPMARCEPRIQSGVDADTGGSGRLFVEVLGPKLVPRGRGFATRRTIVLLHRGAGFGDQTVFRQPRLPYGLISEAVNWSRSTSAGTAQ